MWRFTTVAASAAEQTRQTQVSIEGDQFLINGRLTYEGVTWSPDGDETRVPNRRIAYERPAGSGDLR
jgi:hypothetical protein